MAILFSLLVVGVIARYIFSSPIVWQYELSQVLFVWLMFLGSSVAFYNFDHITIDAFVDILPRMARNITIFLVRLGILFISILLIVEGFKLVEAFSSKYFRTIPLSISWLYTASPISFILVLFYDIVGLLWKRGRLKLNDKQ
jgi:TRAP-type C4-dicarboxylate transport system permease small subunit